MSIGENIKYLRESRGLSQEELADIVGVTDGAVSNWEQGVNIPRMGSIQKIADYFGVMKSDIIESGEASKPIFPASNILPLPETRNVPLIGSIACGTPILAEQNIEDYIKMPDNINADFCLRCVGDSMIDARILDGDLVFIRTQPEVANGAIAAVLIGEEATLKRVHRDGNRLILQAANPIYPPMVYVNGELESIHIIGKAVAFLSTIK